VDMSVERTPILAVTENVRVEHYTNPSNARPTARLIRTDKEAGFGRLRNGKRVKFVWVEVLVSRAHFGPLRWSRPCRAR
jgi:hypothetical protein